MKKAINIAGELPPEAKALMGQVQGVGNRAKQLLIKRIKKSAAEGDQPIMHVHDLGGVYDETVRAMIDAGKLAEVNARIALGDSTVDRIMAYDYELGAEI